MEGARELRLTEAGADSLWRDDERARSARRLLRSVARMGSVARLLLLALLVRGLA